MDRFYFGEHLRWSLFWNSPNVAGAFLCFALVIVWFAGDGLKRWKAGWMIPLLAIEGLLFWTLCKTYSRGALVALFVTLAFAHLVQLRLPDGWVQRGRNGMLFAGRAGFLLLCIFLTGFIGRVSGDYVMSDRSVGNRWEVWQGGLQMISAAPFRGWGEGESGLQYGHWFQPIEFEIPYTGLVSGLLELVVERGTIVFGLFLFLASALILAPFFLRGKGSEGSTRLRCILAAVIACSVLSIVVNNVFSAIWSDGSYRWASISIFAAGLGVLATGREAMHMGSLLRWAGALTCTGLIALTGLSYGLARESGLEIEHRDALVSLERRGETAEKLVRVYPDSSASIVPYGKLFRQLVAKTSGGYRLEVKDPRLLGAGGDSGSVADLSILLGEMCGRSTEGGKAVYVHPEGFPPSSENSMPVALILPAFDWNLTNGLWKDWAHSREIPVIWNPGSGQKLSVDDLTQLHATIRGALY